MPRTTTLKGKPLNLAGEEVKVGHKAPDAMLKKSLVESTRISDTAGKTRIFSVVPSLDTPVCAEQTRRFFKEAVNVPNAQIFTVSCDLPPAQSRFCAAEGLDPSRVGFLSDHKDVDFGQKFGVLIPDLRILSRAVFVVDAAGNVRHAEYVPEVANHPNYDAALAAAKAAG